MGLPSSSNIRCRGSGNVLFIVVLVHISEYILREHSSTSVAVRSFTSRGFSRHLVASHGQGMKGRDMSSLCGQASEEPDNHVRVG